MATIDAASGAVATAGFLPYGESASAGGSFRYTGRRIDPETDGHYYYRALMYAPRIGRFLHPSGQSGPKGSFGSTRPVCRGAVCFWNSVRHVNPIL